MLKSVLDGFAALAFASTFGVGVLLSAVSVAVIQGLLTVVGVVLGSVLPEAHIAALTATGGLMLAGIGLRLLRIREVPVGNMLPALVVAPCSPSSWRSSAADPPRCFVNRLSGAKLTL
jgi:uncharacterized membrane protein YqgA involved in biofilm formation